MTELMTLIGCLVFAGFLLRTSKKERTATAAYNSTEMLQQSDLLFVQIKRATDEQLLETARLELERFRLLYTNDEGINEYDALCVIYNQQKAKLEQTRRYGLEGVLTSEQLNLNEYPTIYRYAKRKN